MLCGVCGRWGSRFCFWISRPESHGSETLSESPEIQRSATEHNAAAKGPRLVPLLNLPPSARVSNGGGAESEGDNVDKNSIAGRQHPRARLSPSLHKRQGPPSASSASVGSQGSHHNSYVGGEHEQRPSNTEISVSTHGHLSHPSDNAHLSRPVVKMSQKDKAIAFAKVALQVAAAGLKAAPIPNLDQIPNVLLSLIQTYEVSHPPGHPQVILNVPSKPLDCRWK